MINKKHVAIVLAALNLMLLGCAYDLTGTWQGNEGGTYYIRQVVNDICWFGELTPQNLGWANVAYGTINGNIINLKWADVPKSGARGSGTLSLSVINDVTLRAQAITGGFGGSTWTKSTTPASGAASSDPLDYYASGAFCRDHPTEPVCYCRIHPEDPTCPRRQLFH